MADIIKGRIKTKLELNPEDVIKGALEANLKTVIVIGEFKDRDSYYLASTSGDLAKINLMLDSVHHKLVRGDFG